MDAEKLRRIFEYDPGTGIITRKVRMGNYPAGSQCVSPLGRYLKVTYLGKTYLLHRLAWVLHTGEQPPPQIDHKNLDGTDNRWDNLRASCPSTNQCNIKVHKRSQTGIKGIMPVRGGKLYRAEVCYQGKRYQKHGRDIEALQRWVIDTRNQLHQDFTRN